jgi:tRNA dimethylallyltransferase
MSATSGDLSKNLVIVIAGPTAAGKSDVSALICAKEKGIIVSADSVQAYRGVQIGANKPSDEERKETPHILVDVADHTENYNAADWRADAICTIQALLCQTEEGLSTTNPRRDGILEAVRGARLEKKYAEEDQLLPVVCGGTMMYLQWLVHGRPDAMRPTQSAVEQALETISKFQTEGDWKGALNHVASFGDIFATRSSQFCGEDWYRLRRTLEVALTVEDADNKEEMIEKLYTGQRQGGLASLGYDIRCFFLCPDDRMSHTRVVDKRCEQMVMRGLMKETAELSLSGCMPDMASRAIGYRQTLEYLNDENSNSNEEEAFNSYLNDFTTATRRYSKRQMSWFRKDQDFMFVPVSLSLSKSERVEAAASAIQRCCAMPRKDFESELSADDSISAISKKKNEDQGKTMKFYKFERHILKAGTQEFDNAFSQAVEFRNRMQAKKRRVEGHT